MEEIKRCEQLEENTWDLTKIYKNDDEFYKALEDIEKEITKYSNYEGHVLDSSKNLYELLEFDTKIERILDKLATYAYRKFDEDITNNASQQLKGKIDNLYTKTGSVSSYVIPELLKSDWEIIDSYISEYPKLEEFRLLLERIFRFKDHMLTSNEEKIICELSNILNSPSKTAGIIRNAEIPFENIHNEDGKEVPLNNENFIQFLKSKDRAVRKEAFETLYKSYANFKDTFTETIQGEVLKNVRLASIRHYDSAKSASLFKNLVTEDVYNNLIETVNNNLSVIYKYYDLKKEESGLSDYSLYDTYINLVEGESKKYSFEEARRIVLDVVKVLGDDYVANINRAFSERWIDIYPNKGKRGGAYSSGCYDTNPYILMNYQGDFHDVSTLIHELGHSMHTLYSNKNNPPQYADYKIFVAEVASTVNEMLLNHYMLEHSKSTKEKQMILSEMMDNFKATLFRQTMFSEFEEFMHEEVEKGNVLTSELLCQKYYELNQKYFGGNVTINEEIRYEWERIPHFYYNFYVYQYATGLSCACYIVNRILNHEENAVEDYLKFLKSGGSMNPIDELKLAGVDITKKEVIESAIITFDKTIDEYKKLKNANK